MAVFSTEERLRLRRTRSEKAIQLAMHSRWEEAVDLNRQILLIFPDDVDSHNRLGKCLMELGRYGEARGSYKSAAKLDPSNTIAAKNLSRLDKLVEDVAAGPVLVAEAVVDPKLFIEESGKTVVTRLVDVAKFNTIAHLTAGDQLDLRVEHGQALLATRSGVVVGQLEPKVAQRVVRLTEIGNRYTAAITSIDETHVRVIIRELYRHPSMGSRPSFPTKAPADIRSYTRDSVFREMDDDDDEDPTDDAEPDAEVAEAALDDPVVAEDQDTADER